MLIPSSILLILLALCNASDQFKCEKDGLFEDEYNCKMYYECLWIGTQFERIEHAKCADNLIYNPVKHRCDEVIEFESQFANGIQTQDDLIQFIRFRNCIEADANKQSNESQFVEVPENVSLSPGAVIYMTTLDNNQKNETQGMDMMNNNSEVFIDRKNTTENFKTNDTINPSVIVNIKASKVSMNITSNGTVERNSNPEFMTNIGSYRNIGEKSENVSTIPKEDSVYVMEDEKMYFGKKYYVESQQNNNNNNNEAKNMSGRDILFTNNANDDKKMTDKQSDLATHMSVMKIFIRRRIVKTTTPFAVGDRDEELSVFVKENKTHPILDKHAVYDDESTKRAKNRPFKNFPILSYKKRRILSFDEESTNNVDMTSTTESMPTSTTTSFPLTEIHTTAETSQIDSIEHRLTKFNTKLDNKLTRERIQLINHSLLSANVNKSSMDQTVEKTTINLVNEELDSKIKNLTFLKFLRVNNINDSYFNQTMIGRKPLKFIKMLRKTNFTIPTINDSLQNSLSDENKNFRTIKPIFIKPNQTQQYITIFPPKIKKVVLNEFESLFDPINRENQNVQNKSSKKMRVFHLKPIQFSTQATPSNMTGFTTLDSTTPVPLRKYHYLYKNLKGRLSNSSNKNKQDSFVVERSNITRITELEKGGQFQRMLLQPADALIECKDNDFGLECSCSITLSPPKCKQLINSFLSSCRIVGCQNNGRCINMAYKYPIPYVCSCPSSHMGTYCEIQRDITSNTDYEYFKSRKTYSTPQPHPFFPLYPQRPRPQPQPKISVDFTEPICQPNPCKNYGVCEIVSDIVKCTCSNSSFTGQYCENVIPEVQTPKQKPSIINPFDTVHQWNCPADCNRDRGQGRCVLSMLGYPKCVCDPGWTGIDCNQKNYCQYSDCLNNGTCSNLPLVKSYICLCVKGFSGRRCEVNGNNYFQQQQVVPYNFPTNNPCGSVTCANNGTCLLSFAREKSQFSFVCKCRPGFTGLLCETKTTECESGPCSLIEDWTIRGRNKISTKTTLTTKQTTEASTSTDIVIPSTLMTTTPISTTSTSTISILSSTIEAITTIVTSLNQKILYAGMNPCRNDPDLCRKFPYGNDSFVCIRSLKSHDYTLCLPTDSVNCEDSNPCLNGGKCLTRLLNNETKTWKCMCNENFTGSLCETEICSKVIKTISNHTMCMTDSIYFQKGGLEPIDTELILDMHNSLRRQVLPSASNMQKMYWDLRLQQLAQKRAQLCTIDIDNVSMRQLPGYGIVIGENLAAGYDSWAHVLSTWISESKHFVFDSTNLSNNIKAGHYTQMIYSGASRIGCGFAQCSGAVYSRYFVCYYAEMQTYQSHYQPYSPGNSCSKCPNNCNEGLCDCKGVYCANGGTLDLNTCKCACPVIGFSGEYCEKIHCPKQDSPFCSQALFQDKCWLYPVVRASCPYMCKLCNKDDPNSNSTLNSAIYTKPSSSTNL